MQQRDKTKDSNLLSNLKINAGMTLVEVLLVLVIGAVILYMSLQQYLIYKYSGDVARVQANIDAIFQAMSGYYKANCGGKTGALSPYYVSPIPSVVPVDLINIELQGYLDNQPLPDPLVNPAQGNKGYVAQFNLVTPIPERSTCQQGSSGSSNCVVIGKEISWTMQVAVYLNTSDPVQAKNYMKLLGADCLSTYSSGSVADCSTSGNTGNYAVWKRLPSSPNPKATSNEWTTTPIVSQFTQMYSTSPINSLTNGSKSTTQYFLCGN